MQVNKVRSYCTALLSGVGGGVLKACRRNIGASAALAQKGQATDPIQKLFLQKVKEYDQKSKAAQGKLVDSNPQIEKELKSEMERIAKVYGGGGNVDMTKFPTFNFTGKAKPERN